MHYHSSQNWCHRGFKTNANESVCGGEESGRHCTYTSSDSLLSYLSLQCNVVTAIQLPPLILGQIHLVCVGLDYRRGTRGGARRTTGCMCVHKRRMSVRLSRCRCRVIAILSVWKSLSSPSQAHSSGLTLLDTMQTSISLLDLDTNTNTSDIQHRPFIATTHTHTHTHTSTTTPTPIPSSPDSRAQPPPLCPPPLRRRSSKQQERWGCAACS